MDHQPQNLFLKEENTLSQARQALAAAPDAALAGPLGHLATEYEALLDRSRRVAELAQAAQEDLEAAMAQVAQLSQVDGLTGAMNRRAFERMLARDWAQAQREGTALTMLVVNVDLFQAYNRIYGSLQGDDALKAVAQALMRSLYREVDLAARMEGDTFVVLLPGTDAQGGRVVGERIVAEVAALEIPHLESHHGGVLTVSVGLASMAPGRQEAPLALVRQAQDALGDAKGQGRHCLAESCALPLPAVDGTDA